RVLEPDGRIVVGPADAVAGALLREMGAFRGAKALHVLAEPVGRVVGDLPVLASGAAEVAAAGAHRKDPRPRIEVVERLLLDRVDADGARESVEQGVEGAALVEPGAAG